MQNRSLHQKSGREANYLATAHISPSYLMKRTLLAHLAHTWLSWTEERLSDPRPTRNPRPENIFLERVMANVAVAPKQT